MKVSLYSVRTFYLIVCILMTNTQDPTTPIEPTTTIDPELQELLDEAQQAQEAKESEANVAQLQQRIAQLEDKLAQAEQIAKKAQSDYIHIKFDFDSYMARNDEQAKTAKVDMLVDVVKKFLPFIDGLRQSLSNIPEGAQDDVLVQGVQMVYNKFLSTLDLMGIKKIESIGQMPDILYHEAISALPVSDESQKGKIIQEFEQGFVYEKGDIKKVITPAKVVIGQ